MSENVYKLTRYEKETIILFNDDEKTASVYTHNKALQRKLDSFCTMRPDLYRLTSENVTWQSKTYEVPKKYISL
jgi:hypothetical protein